MHDLLASDEENDDSQRVPAQVLQRLYSSKICFPSTLSLSLSLLICLFFTDWIFYPILFCFFLFFIVGVPPSQQVLPSVQSAPSVSSVSSRGSSFRRLNSECIPFVFFSFRCFLLPFGCPPSLLLFEYKELQVPTPTFHFFSLTNPIPHCFLLFIFVFVNSKEALHGDPEKHRAEVEQEGEEWWEENKSSFHHLGEAWKKQKLA